MDFRGYFKNFDNRKIGEKFRQKKNRQNIGQKKNKKFVWTP